MNYIKQIKWDCVESESDGKRKLFINECLKGLDGEKVWWIDHAVSYYAGISR